MTVRSVNGQNEDPELEIMLEFLQRTKDGRYASIEKTSLRFSRTRERALQDQGENLGQYYYGLS